MKGLSMEEGPSPQNHNGQLSNSSGGISVGNKQGNEEQNQRTQYSIPGILHFIQHEWARFEMERTQWEVERSELQARIAFLQGERKGQENLKNDLVRRIKMLEYALKQERAKFYKLKYGTEMPGGELVEEPPEGSEGDLEVRREGDDTDSYLPSSQNMSWRQGRQLLRQYLQEIGYTDTLIDVRSNRVRSLLGLSNTENEENLNNLGPTINGSDVVKRAVDTQIRKKQGAPGTGVSGSLEERMLLDAERAVMANFNFLTPDGGVEVDEDEADLSDDLDDETVDEQDHVMRQIRTPKGMVGMEDVDAETVEVLQEFDFLSSGEHSQDEQQQQSETSTEWDVKEWGIEPALITKLKDQYRQERAKTTPLTRPKRATLQAMLASLGGDQDLMNTDDDDSSDTDLDFSGRGESGGTGQGFSQPGRSRPLLTGSREDETIEVALGLGELAQLTVNNEADQTYDVTTNKEPLRKTWNAKYTLRSHFDGVRALAFHPTEPVLITASEDHTLKLWNLQKTVPAKKSASLDVEPVYTFRGHTGAVLCVCVSANGELCYSGGLDGHIHCWKLPDSNIDPYDAFEPSVLSSQLKGHTDAVWGLTLHPSNGHLLSCSADATVRLWNPQSQQQTLLSTYTADQDGIPTSVDFVKSEAAPVQMVCSYNTNNCVIYDIETGKPVIRLDTQQLNENGVIQQINKVVCHPTLGMTVTGGEDRQVRFWDNSTGRLVHSMVAHLDAVTALAMDPNGLYLLSGSHDCSIRLWHLDNKTCVQEITAHRKKFDEAIFDVAFHPSKPYIASAGADALAKVFV